MTFQQHGVRTRDRGTQAGLQPHGNEWFARLGRGLRLWSGSSSAKGGRGGFPISLVSREFIRKVEAAFPLRHPGPGGGRRRETSWLDINNTQAGVIAVRHLNVEGLPGIGYLGGPGATSSRATGSQAAAASWMPAG